MKDAARELMRDIMGPRRAWLAGSALRCGDHVAVEGRDGAFTILARGDHSALVAHLWHGRRERVPLTMLRRV